MTFNWFHCPSPLTALILAAALLTGQCATSAWGSEAATTIVCPACDVASLTDALAIAPSGFSIEVRGEPHQAAS
ncbi:MAG: hypothetical protein R2853_12025 [Thermomicrobiales bacterium]